MKFSVTIPTYKNVFLKETIDSVLEQEYKDFEIIIVNDASPYDIDSIVSSYKDSRIKYYTNKRNCGAKNVVDNWNICLSKACGDYIMCIGDDDKITPNCLHDFANYIERYPLIDIFHAGTEIIDDKSYHITTLNIRPEWESVISFIYSAQNSGLGSYLFKTSTLKKNGGFYKLPYGWASDFITAYNAAKNNGIVNIQSIGFQYRGNGQSISHDMKGIEGKIIALQKYEDWLRLFLNNLETKEEEDLKKKKNLIRSLSKRTNHNIDDLIEFDIRKNFIIRGLYWILNRAKYDISIKRIILCLLKSLLYKFKQM